MCGIVGYIGKKRPVGFILDILKRLEYRGYDSCGVAVADQNKIYLKKIQGKIETLLKKVDLQKTFEIGVAHTRWATHGAPSYVNAHPHFDCRKRIFLVHNGIIENFKELKEYLQRRGHKFVSCTDTEVIVHLIEEFEKEDGLVKAVFNTVKELKGSFAFSVFSRDTSHLIVVRKESPLCLGVLKDGFVVASDIPALAHLAKEVVVLEDNQIGVISSKEWKIFSFAGRRKKIKTTKIDVDYGRIDKKNYAHFMLKEIFEQPAVLRRLLSFYAKDNVVDFKELSLTPSYLKKINRIFIFACGTAYHAGLVGKYFLEKYCRMNVEVDVSSEARYRTVPLRKDDLVITISQSGETADTLAVVKEAKKKGVKILGICNVLGSTLTKEVDALIYTLAGPEIGVASTKAYTAQIASLYLFSLYLARIKKTLDRKKEQIILSEMKRIPSYIEDVLKDIGKIKRIAKKFSRFGCFLFLGRGINYPSALEGALKLKEISYIPAEGYPAGEMKHGPIALIDEYRAVVCIALKDELYEKMVSNISEIKARKGKVLGILTEHDTEAAALSDEKLFLPSLKNYDLSPLLIVVPLQLFAYFVAKNLGCEIDQPRNLAKSVTVE